MDIDKLKEQFKSLSDEDKKEFFKDIHNSIGSIRNSIYNSMEPVYKAMEPIAAAISSFNQSIIDSFIKSESLQNTVNTLLNWFRNIDWQKVSETLNVNSKFCDEVIQQLEANNIDINLIADFDLSQIAELYIALNECGLTFTDLIEDNLQLFNEFKYEKAQIYINIIKKRKKQITENTPKVSYINDSFVENLKYSEKIITELVQLAIREYDKGNITLSEEDKKLLIALKQNRYLTNTELGKILGYQPSEIESICVNTRKLFNIDYFDDDIVKRNLLTCLARNIVIK
jgi:hypothetical protein